MKLLVISDLHYPLPYSRLYPKVIRKEKPDIVVLLGDVVAANNSREIVEVYKRFIKEYVCVFPTKNTVFLVGDNEGRNSDYSLNRQVFNFLKGIPKLNKDLLTYSYKNLFFFHGNLESSFRQESAGRKIAKAFASLDKRIVPYLLAKAVRHKFGLKRNTIALLGHLHYLGFSDNSVFCGTFSKEREVYAAEDSLGYVVVNIYGEQEIGKKDISLVHLASNY